MAALWFSVTSNLACSAANLGPNDNDHIVRLHGLHFAVDGHPFVPVGVNNHYLTFGTQGEVEAVLDGAVALGATTISTFLQPVIGDPKLPGSTIWDSQSRFETSNLGTHGVYMLSWDSQNQKMIFNDGPNGLGRLDLLVVEARKRGLKLIIAFLDFWSFTGGAQQMRAWYGSSDKNTFFFQDERTKADYKAWVAHVLDRVNPLTGIAYKDEPAIFAWELMNEPDGEPGGLMLSWTNEMAHFVKSLDSKHLLASGHANVATRLSDIGLPDIDFGTWHGYPLYYDLSNEQFGKLISDFCSMGRKAGKPVLLEEFGLARSHNDQAEVYRSWLQRIEADDACAGWLVWRLVGRQESGKWPTDRADQFDIHPESGETWTILREAARELIARRGAAAPSAN
jgi:mannan endo-1,4-beta-mannosidase